VHQAGAGGERKGAEEMGRVTVPLEEMGERNRDDDEVLGGE
jgi:hypothetical protein